MSDLRILTQRIANLTRSWPIRGMSALGQSHVRFTPESGHVQRSSRCLLWANSGHSVDRLGIREFPRAIKNFSAWPIEPD